jgi:hypothetical protein
VDGTEGTAWAIATGRDHNCAVQANTGKVVCWGFNYSREATPPATVDGTEGTATAIALGTTHSLAIAAPEPDAHFVGLASLATLALVALGRVRAQATTASSRSRRPRG